MDIKEIQIFYYEEITFLLPRKMKIIPETINEINLKTFHLQILSVILPRNISPRLRNDERL